MSTHEFSSEEISRLSGNPYVKKCSEKTVTYTYEFKIRVLEQYRNGVSAKEIWRRAGFDLGVWRNDYARECIKRWRKIVKKNGMQGLAYSQGMKATDRTKTKTVTDADKIKYLELKVRYLKAENDFLAKLRAKRAESNSGQKKNIKSLSN